MFQDAGFVEFYTGLTFTTTWIGSTERKCFFKRLCEKQSFFYLI